MFILYTVADLKSTIFRFDLPPERFFEKNLVEKKGIFKPQTAYSDKVALLKLYPGISPENAWDLPVC